MPQATREEPYVQYCTGVNVNWAGIAITGLTDLSWSWASGSSQGRSHEWSSDAGTITIEYTGNGPAKEMWNKVGDMNITGGRMDLHCKAMLVNMRVTGELNGIAKAALEFNIFC